MQPAFGAKGDLERIEGGYCIELQGVTIVGIVLRVHRILAVKT